MKNLKQLMVVGCCLFLATVYAEEQSEIDLGLFIKSKKDVPATFTQAWELAQSNEADVLEVAAKIKRVQSCTDCSVSERQFFINVLLDPVKSESNIREILPDDIVKEYNLYLYCATGYCPIRDSKSVLRRILNKAIKNNRKEFVELFLDIKNINNSRDFSRALMSAVRLGYKDIVQLFVDKRRGDINFKGWNGDTVLKVAEEKGDPEIVEMLKKAGAQ